MLGNGGASLSKEIQRDSIGMHRHSAERRYAEERYQEELGMLCHTRRDVGEV